MKKIFAVPVIIFLALARPTLAADLDESLDFSGIDEMYKHTQAFETPFAGQKQITDEQFEKTYQEVKAKRDKKKNRNSKTLKGKGYNEEDNGGYINETAEKNLILSIPLSLVNGDGTELSIGHYKIVGEKTKDNKVYLDFYQSRSLIAKVPAIETESDFDENEVNFVKLLPYNEQRVKVIYGSMDFNAYTFIKIKNEISDQNSFKSDCYPPGL